MTDLMEVMAHLTEHFRAIEEENRELKEEQRRQMEARSRYGNLVDLIVLPFVIDGSLWLIEKALSKTREAKN